MGITNGRALASMSQRTPSLTPMTEAEPPHRICSQGNAAVASPPDASWAATPPPEDAILRTCRHEIADEVVCAQRKRLSSNRHGIRHALTPRSSTEGAGITWVQDAGYDHILHMHSCWAGYAAA